MKEKYKKSEFGDAILVDDGTDWNLVAALYGYNGSVEQDAPGVAERAALFVAAPNLLERAEAAEARVAELSSRVWRIEPDEDGDNGETWRQAFIDCDMMRMQAEAHANLAEARIIELQARIDMLESEVMQQHHIASACAEA